MVCQSIDEAKFRNRAQRNYGGTGETQKQDCRNYKPVVG